MKSTKILKGIAIVACITGVVTSVVHGNFEAMLWAIVATIWTSVSLLEEWLK